MTAAGCSMPIGTVVAEAGNEHMHVTLRTSAPLALHDLGTCWRTDGNSAVRVTGDGATVFFSNYEPIGHTFRRRGTRCLHFEEKPVRIRLIDDPDPTVGKWIEAVWLDPGGLLHGWYHAEEVAPCPTRLYVPHIGEVISHDDGASWQCRGELLRMPADRVECTWQNGFFAGGYGDLSVVPDRDGQALYLFFSSYHSDDISQGVAVARLPIAGGPTSAGLVWWSTEGWRPPDIRGPKPLWPALRGWRHADPDCFWGPALHYNRALDGYVMLLNRTSGGAGDLVQEGIYASFNRTLDDPAAWSRPLKLVSGGAWYPQVVGLEDGCGDAEAGAIGRFFMAGFSAWEIELSNPEPRGTPNRPLRPTKADFSRAFGPARRCPW